MNVLSFFLCLVLSVLISCLVTFEYLKPSVSIVTPQSHVVAPWEASFFGHQQLYIPTHEYVIPIEENDNRGMKFRTFLVRRIDKSTMTVLASDLALQTER